MPRVLESIGILEERGLNLEVPVVFPVHFDDISSLAERFPRLRIVIDHLGSPRIGSHEMPRWSAELSAVSDQQNVVATVSGLNPALGWPDWTPDDLRRSVGSALECFGAERLMCGSDWPVALLNGDHDRVWTLTSRALTAAAPDQAEQLLGGNACRISALDRPRGAS